MEQLESNIAAVLESAMRDPRHAGRILSGADGLPDDRALALVALDPIGIQGLVLASRRMKTRLGASDLLGRWDAEWRSSRGERRATIYAGGGQALLVVPLADADDLVREAKDDFARRLHGRLGGAWLPVSEQELATGSEGVHHQDLQIGGGGFGALVDRLGCLLRADKDSFAGAASPWTGPACEECGLRPRLPNRKVGQNARCLVCDAHHQAAPANLPTLDELETTVAFLALDGTSVGRALQAQRTLGEYAALSSKLLAAFDWQVLGQRLDRTVLPLLRGGDDLLLAFGAGKGTFDLVIDLVQRVAEGLQPLGIGLGAGLVVSSSLPAGQACELAQRLLSSAKADARTRGLAVALDFELVQQGSMVALEVDALRGVSRQVSVALGPLAPVGGNLALGWRPLSLDEARDLADAARSAGSEDWSAAYRVQAQLREAVYPALIAAAYDAARDEQSPGGRNYSRGLLGLQPGDSLPRLDAAGRLSRAAPRSRQAVGGCNWESAIFDLLDIHRMDRSHS